MLGEEPGERHLRRCRVVRRGDLAHEVDQRLVGGAVLLGESGDGGCGRPRPRRWSSAFDGAGEESLAEWAEGHEADAELGAAWAGSLLRARASPQRVLALQGGDGMDGVGAADGADAGLGQTEVADLAAAMSSPTAPATSSIGTVGVDAVLVEEVDAVGAQPAQ